MPTKLRLDSQRSIEVSTVKLSPQIGCGLMLANLPEFDASDPMVNAMTSYGYVKLRADKPAEKLVSNPALLKQFYDSAITSKTPLRSNFKAVYGALEIYMALDAAAKTAWFVSDQHNKIALMNYARDAVSLGLKTLGILLMGSTVRLTPIGWQNLHDVLTDKFLNAHREVQRVEVMGMLGGVRWRPNCLGLGVTLLNFREPADIAAVVERALRGETGPDIQS
jgi:hypothetical protein